MSFFKKKEKSFEQRLFGFLLIVFVLLIRSCFIKATESSNPSQKEQNSSQIMRENTLQQEKEHKVSESQQSKTVIKRKGIRGEAVFEKANASYGVVEQFTFTPDVWIVVEKEDWEKLSKAEQIELTYYAENLIPIIRKNPEDYGQSYQTAAHLCFDCWAIAIVSDNKMQGPIVQGGTPWREEDPCCRATKASDFCLEDTSP